MLLTPSLGHVKNDHTPSLGRSDFRSTSSLWVAQIFSIPPPLSRSHDFFKDPLKLHKRETVCQMRLQSVLIPFYFSSF